MEKEQISETGMRKETYSREMDRSGGKNVCKRFQVEKERPISQYIQIYWISGATFCAFCH